MNTPSTLRTETLLANAADRGAAAFEVAALLVAEWQRIERALTPILGIRGVAALFGRSLNLAARAHPWLAAIAVPAQEGADPVALEAVFAGREVRELTLGGDALLSAFKELLVSLIGLSLTERLLAGTPQDDTSGDPAQET